MLWFDIVCWARMERKCYKTLSSIIKPLCFHKNTKLCVCATKTLQFLTHHGVKSEVSQAILVGAVLVWYNSWYKVRIVSSAPRPQWSWVTQHRQALPERSLLHYTFDFKLIFGSCTLPNTSMLPNFSLLHHIQLWGDDLQIKKLGCNDTQRSQTHPLTPKQEK